MDDGAVDKGGPAERLVNDLHQRLQRHRLWDCLLKCAPPPLAICYAAILVFRAGWIGGGVTVFALAAGLGILLGQILSFDWSRTGTASVARLIDDKVAGKDRFVTLATVDRSLYPSFLLYRLRREATGLLDRINLTRDFPFKLRRSSSASMIGSVVFVLLFHIFLQTNLYSSLQVTSSRELSSLAQELSQDPRFAELGHRLAQLEVSIREQGLLDAGNEDRIHELLRKIRKQLAASSGRGEGDGDALGKAAGTLQRLAESIEKGKGMGQGSMAMQPSGKEDRGKELTEPGDGEGSGDPAMRRKAGEGTEKSMQAKIEKRGNYRGTPDSGRKDQRKDGHEKGSDKGATPKEDLRGEGKTDRQEQTPQGEIPRRFYQAGEQGEKGIEGGRFVIVELPEGEGGLAVSRTVKRSAGQRRPKVPVSNVPLPPRQGRDARQEKQQIPLEYQRMLR